KGRAPFYEPGIDELITLTKDRLRFTTEYRQAVPDADVVMITVGTPPLETGEPDLGFFVAAVKAIGECLTEGFKVIVTKSTVPIGTGSLVESIIHDTREQSGPTDLGQGFAVASNPEFLREGSALSDSLYPDRIVVGVSDERSLSVMRE